MRTTTSRDYTVNGKSFGPYAGDARRFAMRQAMETGTYQAVACNGLLLDAYTRGKSGLAELVFSAKIGSTVKAA